MSRRLELSATSNYENLRVFRNRLESVLAAHNVANDLCGQVSLCFSEMATNCVEHSPDIVQLGLIVRIFKKCLEVEVASLNPNKTNATLKALLESAPEEVDDPWADIDTQRSGGRGFTLLNQLCDDVDVPEPEVTVFDGERLWKNRLLMRWHIKLENIPAQILVVDDELALNALYCAYLSETYAVFSAYSAFEAMQVLTEQHIDLILTDMKMPNQNGLEFRKSLSLIPDLADVPFVLTSAHNIQEISECKLVGIDDFLLKPIQKNELQDCVARVLARSEQLHRDMQEKIFQKIHFSLQPKIPDAIGPWRFALKNEADHHGGGDLLLWETRGDDVFIIVADVMGHDEAAKFFAHAYKGYMRGFLSACEELPQPNEFLRSLSGAMSMDGLLSSGLCTCCAFLLRGDGTFQVANAGHPPALLIRYESIDVINDVGMLPGLQADFDYTSINCRLDNGERLMVYTDGLFDEQQPTTGFTLTDSNSVFGTSSVAKARSLPMDIAAEQVFQKARSAPRRVYDDALLLFAEYSTAN